MMPKGELLLRAEGAASYREMDNNCICTHRAGGRMGTHCLVGRGRKELLLQDRR